MEIAIAKRGYVSCEIMILSFNNIKWQIQKMHLIKNQTCDRTSIKFSYCDIFATLFKN